MRIGVFRQYFFGRGYEIKSLMSSQLDETLVAGSLRSFPQDSCRL